MSPHYTLVSHALCPYVQRAAIALTEKGLAFKRIDIDLANKPQWFLDISPLGKTPVLLVDGQPIFESAVICEFLEDTQSPRLHAADPLQRARERGWIEFGSAFLNSIAAFYNAADEAALQARAGEICHRLVQLDAALGDGPYFSGARFSLVDAVFGPVFRYFDVFEVIGDFGFFQGLPRLSAWRSRLAARPSVRGAVASDYSRRLRLFLLQRDAALARRIADAEVEVVVGQAKADIRMNSRRSLPL